ncbi:MAG: hypothetical protein WCB11_15265, partial [Terriglobales bacterium]
HPDWNQSHSSLTKFRVGVSWVTTTRLSLPRVGHGKYPISGKWHLSGELGPLVHPSALHLQITFVDAKGDAEGATALDAYYLNSSGSASRT